MTSLPWIVLVLLGASGTGKSVAAETIARERGITWMQADDLRLALQYSHVSLPERTEQLYFFLNDPDFALRPTEEVVRAFIGVAEAMAPAVRIVIGNHVAINAPMVIEGDCILPSLAIDPALRPHVESGAVRFCCVAAETHREMLENMLVRGRGMDQVDVERAARHADANWGFGHWLAATSASLGIPVVTSRPFDSLTRRITAAVGNATEVETG